MDQSCFSSLLDLNRYHKKGNCLKNAKELVFLAKTAEASARYDDMCQIVSVLIKQTEKLSSKERQLFTSAFKNAIESRRSAWKVVNSIKGNGSLVAEYRERIRKEITNISVLLVDLTTKHLLPKVGKNTIARIYYLKTKADYLRYMAEVNHTTTSGKEAGEVYSLAWTLSKKVLKPANSLRLGLALNYSVCMYEVIKNKELACWIATEAFSYSLDELDHLSEQEYKDSTIILELLRDNLVLWSSRMLGTEGKGR